jgi:hypothetical protein
VIEVISIAWYDDGDSQDKANKWTSQVGVAIHQVYLNPMTLLERADELWPIGTMSMEEHDKATGVEFLWDNSNRAIKFQWL